MRAPLLRLGQTPCRNPRLSREGGRVSAEKPEHKQPQLGSGGKVSFQFQGSCPWDEAVKEGGEDGKLQGTSEPLRVGHAGLGCAE